MYLDKKKVCETKKSWNNKSIRIYVYIVQTDIIDQYSPRSVLRSNFITSSILCVFKDVWSGLETCDFVKVNTLSNRTRRLQIVYIQCISFGPI